MSEKPATPYCTIEDIEKRISKEDLVQLTNDDPEATDIDVSVVTSAIADATELVNGFLRGRYQLPLDPVPGLITKLCIDAVIYYVWERRRRAEMPDGVKASYDNGLKLLEKIQKAQLFLSATELSTDKETYGSGDYRCNKTPADRTFSKNLLEKF